MDIVELQRRIFMLERQISELPIGSVTKKTVKGRVYHYHRWNEGHKTKEKYIGKDELDSFVSRIARRKELEQELKELKRKLKEELEKTILEQMRLYGLNDLEDMRSSWTRGAIESDDALWVSDGLEDHRLTYGSRQAFNIIKGQSLKAFTESVKGLRKRECFPRLVEFLYGSTYDRVFILYGLRRTGKTTMIRQAIAQMDDAALDRTAFIQTTPSDTLATMNRNLKALQEQGFKYVFIDEVTLLDDFIEGSALFSDIFAACGMKIVLSGTDSLGFLFAEDQQLYDRCIMLHTTFIPYREFETVLGIRGIDEYIRYGGTMNLGGIHYNEHCNETATFSTKSSTDEYIDSSIARNIQHSLKCYDGGSHFHNLRGLYENDELTSAINRVVEDMNHSFTLEVLTRDFKSNDLGISANNMRRDPKSESTVLDDIDLYRTTERLKELLEIRNKDEMLTQPNMSHVQEIKDYLDLLDLTCDIDVVRLPMPSNQKEHAGSMPLESNERTVIAQPGLRYAQAAALLRSLLTDPTFADLSLKEKTYVQDRILSEIKGRMMEDIVLLETKLANPGKEVLILQFPVGEFDMVLFDPQRGSCRIFEVKHSSKIFSQQYRHLVDKDKCALVEHRYGTIEEKAVIYRGESTWVEGIAYRNIEEYLLGIADVKR